MDYRGESGEEGRGGQNRRALGEGELHDAISHAAWSASLQSECQLSFAAEPGVASWLCGRRVLESSRGEAEGEASATMCFHRLRQCPVHPVSSPAFVLLFLITRTHNPHAVHTDSPAAAVRDVSMPQLRFSSPAGQPGRECAQGTQCGPPFPSLMTLLARPMIGLRSTSALKGDLDADNPFVECVQG